MDYESEQQMELEALEAIYMDELQEYIGTLPDPWPAVGKTYKMTIDPHEEGDEEVDDADEKLMELLFAHTASYPDEGPCAKLRSVRGLSDSDIAQANSMLREEIEANKGMAMIYTLVTAAKEWLRNRIAQGAVPDEEVLRKKQADEEEARRAAARAHGTAVTVETFKAWKAKYDAEVAAAKVAAKSVEGAKTDASTNRVSGKAWFQQDRAEAATEADALSEDDEEDFDVEDGDLEDEDDGEEYVPGDDEELEEDEIDYDDDDDEGMLDAL